MCKTTELLLLPCVQQARAGEAAAQGGRRQPRDLRLGWKARDAEEREGNSWDCSPWTEEDEERVVGGQPWRSARAAMDGGAPVLPRRRGEAEDAQLVLAMLVAIAASPFGASLR
jgi:hypothetical protein